MNKIIICCLLMVSTCYGYSDDGDAIRGKLVEQSTISQISSTVSI